MKSTTRSILLFTHILSFLWVSNPAIADKIPVETFFKMPDVSGMTLSPNGKMVAFLLPIDDVIAVAMVDLEAETKPNVMRGNRSIDVNTVRWASNEHVVFSSVEHNIYAHSLHSLQVGKRKARLLNDGDSLRLVDPLIEDSNYILAWISATHQGRPRLVRYNVKNGRAKSVNYHRELEGKILGWETSFQGEVISARIYHDGEDRLMHRTREDGLWREIDLPSSAGLSRYEFLGYDETRNAYWVNGYKSGDTTASLYHYDFVSERLSEPVYRDETYDLFDNSSLMRCSATENVVGIRYTRDMLKTVWFDEYYKAIQVKLDQSFSDTVNVIRETDRARNRVLVFSFADNNPGVYRVVDLEKNSVLLAYNARSDLASKTMAKQLSLTVKVRDGLSLEGYVTLPGPKDAGPYPMVTLAHGGPWSRDVWGFDAEAQFLANRGYAVLQLNFRGSSGFNKTITHDHSGDFRGMIDDLSEVTRHLVKHGVADPERLAIMGASFGGYAAVGSAAFDPDLYQCAISIAGTFDIKKQMENWRSRFWKKRQGTAGYDAWVEHLGDPEISQQYIESISPIHHVDKIKIPILLIHGKSDRVVSYKQSKSLAKALKKNGNKPETLFIGWHGHSSSDLKGRVKTYSKIEKFLAEHLN